MKSSKASTFLTYAEKCNNILASNWRGTLSTVKADAKGSKGEIYSSKVKYFVRKGRPYIWVPEKELHNVNTIMDERGSFAVTNPFPGPLANLLKLIKKLPARVALTGDVVPLTEGKVKLAEESLMGIISKEQKVIDESSYSVSSILKSSTHGSVCRSQNLRNLLDSNEKNVVYKFSVSSCIFIDGNGGTHEVDMEDFEASNDDPLSPYSTSLIDGINQSEVRRTALLLFCVTQLSESAKDAFVLSIDRKGFDVLGKVLGPVMADGSRRFLWKEFRFTFKEEARDAESFCQRLIDMEAEALGNVSSFTGL